MALILEDGSGVAGANSNVTAAFVTAYLAERNRATENEWSTGGAAVLDACCIAGTDHIENKFRALFRGTKQHRDLRTARAVLTFTAQPSDTETVTLGSVAYRFVASLAQANDVLIGASLSASVGNLVLAVNAATSGSGVTHHADTVANADAAAEEFYDDTLLATAKTIGTPGNSVASTATVSGATWSFATLNGGSDRRQTQPLSFPRLSLFDRDGVQVIGMPTQLLYATAEYAVRAKGLTLAPDPTVDELGGIVTRLKDKTGPLETDTEYLPGSVGSGRLPAYPAADRLLREFTRSSGGVIRA